MKTKYCEDVERRWGYGTNNHVLDGVEIPPVAKRQFLQVVWPIGKHCESVLWCVQQKRSFNAQQRHDMRCGLLSEFFDHLLNISVAQLTVSENW